MCGKHIGDVESSIQAMDRFLYGEHGPVMGYRRGEHPSVPRSTPKMPASSAHKDPFPGSSRDATQY